MHPSVAGTIPETPNGADLFRLYIAVEQSFGTGDGKRCGNLGTYLGDTLSRKSTDVLDQILKAHFADVLKDEVGDSVMQ